MIAALLLAAAAPVTQANAADRRMIETLALWTEGQYIIGVCEPHLGLDFPVHWRNWWHGTDLGSTEAGRHVLATGEAAYQRGVADRKELALTAERCRFEAQGWADQMAEAIGPEGG